jgi:hypothetical protein
MFVFVYQPSYPEKKRKISTLLTVMNFDPSRLIKRVIARQSTPHNYWTKKREKSSMKGILRPITTLMFVLD